LAAENALRVPNVKLIFDLAFTLSLHNLEHHKVKFTDCMGEDFNCHWRFDLRCETPLGMWLGEAWIQELEPVHRKLVG